MELNKYDGFSATWGQTSVAVTASIQFSSAYTRARAKVLSGSIRLELEVAIDIPAAVPPGNNISISVLLEDGTARHLVNYVAPSVC
jgi:hypothetical protein